MRWGESKVVGIEIIKATFFLICIRLVKYFDFIIPGLSEPLEIMASSSASSLTNSLKAGECALTWTG